MKKIIFLIFIISLLLASGTVFAADYEGYIFRIDENTPVLFSGEGIEYLSDGLYVAETKEDIQNFVSEESIITMFPNYTLELFDSGYPSTTSDEKYSSQWAHSLIDAWSAREKGVFGDGVKIGIIDSGLNVNHPDLNKAKIVDAYNCLSGVSNKNYVTDNVGHGTHVAGIIAAQIDNGLHTAGIASGAYICPLKITDSSSLSLTDLYKGIQKAIDFECDIVNMSLGGSIKSGSAINEVNSWIKKARDAGIIVVAATGNYGGTDLVYPAACDGVIGVGAVNNDGSLWSKSQRNTSVFVTAPGGSILSLSYSGSTTTKSGTSMACPHVVAAVALIKQLRPQSDVTYIKNVLMASSVDYGDTGYDTSFGYGILNIENIMREMAQYLPEFVVSHGISGSAPRIHIHNNSISGSAAVYLASYADNVMTAVKMIPLTENSKGVTSVENGNGYNTFYFWSDKLQPYYRFDYK